MSNLIPAKDKATFILVTQEEGLREKFFDKD